MKTDEQVLKEWMADRIAFEIRRRKFFTQFEFCAVVDTLCYGRLTNMSSYGVQNGLPAAASRASNLTLSFEKFSHTNIMLSSEEYKHLRDPRLLARFESANELYAYLTKKDADNGIVRARILAYPTVPAEKIKVSFVVHP